MTILVLSFYNRSYSFLQIRTTIKAWIFLILSFNKDSHKRLDEFEILQDPTKELRVSCP